MERVYLSRNLRVDEVTCGCGCGFDNISDELTQKFQKARDLFGEPIIITSGCRCTAHNEIVGGKTNSAHLKGLALDLAVYNPTPFKMQKLAFCLGRAGFERADISTKQCYIHVDIDRSKPAGITGC